MNGQAPVGEDDLHSYVDGRLSPDRVTVVEAYLAAHPEAASRVHDHEEQRRTLRALLQAKHDEPVPARLRVASIEARKIDRWRYSFKRIAAAGLWLLVGAGSGWMANDLLPAGSPPPQGLVVDSVDSLANEAMNAHRVFVAEIRHPVEVDASQEAHLVQWLSKRLGRPLRVPDLSREGYQLMGGRLLPASDGPAAQLMYSDAAGKRLTVYLTSENGAGTSFRYVRDGEVAGFYWREDGFGYAVFAEADRQMLLATAEAIHHQTSGL